MWTSRVSKPDGSQRPADRFHSRGTRLTRRVRPLGLISLDSSQKGRYPIDRDGHPKAAPPRIHAANDFVSGPD
jgi:hypothetical protein